MPALADFADARCDIYTAGSSKPNKMVPCRFSQRQGFVTITRKDGAVHELKPVGDAVGNFQDQDGRNVFRQSGLGDQGLIFRFPDESVYVYWSTVALQPGDPGNPTAPFTTDEYDTTTLLRCRYGANSAIGNCPAGILRMEDGQASVVVQSPKGEQFTINFMTEYVNATNREADAHLEGDTWIVTINGIEEYQVPLAEVEGD